MWIRSQNKEVIINTNTIVLFNKFSRINGNFIVDKSGDTEILLGKYSTKERALKVLDKIVAQMELCTETRTQIKPYSNGSDWDTCERVATVIFQMPQDSDIEDEI